MSFSKQVAPILVEKCQACHGAMDPKGGYQLHTFAHLQKPGESESPPVVATKIDESWLIELITSDDAESRMPKDADALPTEQIEIIKRWIAEGAKFDGPAPTALLTTYAPRPAHPDPPAQYRRPVPITALAFTPDGSQLAVAGYHEVTVWSVADGSLVRRIKGLPQRVMGLAFHPGGNILAIAGGAPGVSGEVKLFDWAQGTAIKDLAFLPDVAFRVTFSPDGKKLAACAADRTIRVFDVDSGAQEQLIEDHADWVMGVAWSPDGSQLASASRDKTAKLFSATTGDSIATFPGHNEAVYGVGFTHDGKRVISGGADKKLVAWKTDDGQKAADKGGFAREVLRLVTVGEKIFAGSADHKVQQHRGESIEPFKTYEGLSDAVFSLSYHEASQRIAAGAFNGEVRVWNAEDGQTVLNLIAAPGHQAQK